jgi:hypothetical protein
MTELDIYTIVILEAWLLFVSIGENFYNPFDEWLWYFFMSLYPTLLGVLLFSAFDKYGVGPAIRKWLQL